MAVKYFDCFAGIGGFRSGLELAGGYECVGFCEIDEKAETAYRAMYDTEREVFFNDASKIDTDKMPDFELFVGGFPCQPFSYAGKRRGFEDTRGTLFYHIARIIKAKRPSAFLLENVPGLLSHGEGKTYKTILETFSELGYCLEWCVLNSADHQIPQSRKRVFIVGYLDFRCAGKVFPLESGRGKDPQKLIDGSQGQRVYSTDGAAVTQCAGSGGWGGKTGLYFIDMNPDPKLTENARCITARQDSGISNHKGEHSGVLVEEPRAVINPEKEKTRQNGRRVKEPNEPMFTLTVQDRHGVVHRGRRNTTMNSPVVFSCEEFGEIRTLNIDGEPWFIGKEIAGILGYENGSRDINRHVDPNDKKVLKNQNYQNGTFEIPNRGLTVINESGLYSLILSSKLPSAKKFSRWVTSEILPSLRKNGAYILCVNSRESFESNKNNLRRISEREENPAVRKLLEQDAVFLDHIQAQTATAREFLLIVRIRNLKEKEIFSYLNRIEKTLRENGFSARRYGGEDIKTLLGVYFEQNVTTEKFDNFDGERWILHE